MTDQPRASIDEPHPSSGEDGELTPNELLFLSQAARGCTSGKLNEWPQLRPAISKALATMERQKARLTAAEQRVELLQGAIEAQDEREREAGEKCGVLHLEYGCDWPDAVAEKVVGLRKRVEELERHLVRHAVIPNYLAGRTYVCGICKSKAFTIAAIQHAPECILAQPQQAKPTSVPCYFPNDDVTG